MKKFLTLLISCLILAMCLTACEAKEVSGDDEEGKKKTELTLDDEEDETEVEETEAPTEETTPEPTEAPTPEPTEVPTPEPTEAPTPEPTETPEAEHTYKVEVVEVGEQLVVAIKLYRDYTGAGLADAKAAIDGAPCVVMETTSEEDANACKEAFEESGSVVKLYVDGEEIQQEVIEPEAAEESDESDETDVTDGEDGFEQLSFSIFLEDVGPEKVKVIKVIRDELGYGLKEAKDLVDAAPVIIYVAEDLMSADDLCNKLAEVGSTATIETFANPVVGENPKDEADFNPEVTEESEATEEPESSEVPEAIMIPEEEGEITDSEEADANVGTLYSVYLYSCENEYSAAQVISDFMYHPTEKALSMIENMPCVVWESFDKRYAKNLHNFLKLKGCEVELKETENVDLNSKLIIPEDEKEIATLNINRYGIDSRMSSTARGEVVYGEFRAGDKVSIINLDGEVIETTIKEVHSFGDKAEVISVGELGTISFEDKINKGITGKVVKRTE